ncbi:MAG: glutamyl-tRNA reductase [Aestuariibacter sp.]
MSLITFGINHKTAPVDIREKVAFSPDGILEAMQSLSHRFENSENVILSTCNRTEVYICGEDLSPQDLQCWLAEFHQLPSDYLNDICYFYDGEHSIEHLMSVACGLDSLILGEPQILGQLKQAFTRAKCVGTVSTFLERLFQTTFATAKQVRTETDIGANAVSVAYSSVQLAKHIFSDLVNSRVLLVGAGETIELVATHIQQHGNNNMVVANRTIAKGVELGNKFNARTVTLSHLHSELPSADIVISSTASQLPLIGKGMVETALKTRKNQPMLFIDLAVPRDIEQEVDDLEGAFLYTIDDLQSIVQQNMASREQAAEQARKLIDQQVKGFISWQQAQHHIDIVKSFRQQAELEKQRLLARAQQQLNDGQSGDAVLSELANKLTNSLIHAPTKALRTAAERHDKEMLDKLISSFGIDTDK